MGGLWAFEPACLEFIFRLLKSCLELKILTKLFYLCYVFEMCKKIICNIVHDLSLYYCDILRNVKNIGEIKKITYFYPVHFFVFNI